MSERRVTEVVAEGTLFAIRFDDGSCEFYNRTGEAVKQNGNVYRGTHTREVAPHIPTMCPAWLAVINKEKKVWNRIVAFLKRLINRVKKAF